MDTMHEGAGTEMPEQDKALGALATLLEAIGQEAGEAFVRNGPDADSVIADCTRRAETVVRAIIGLPSVTPHGASAKARAVRSGAAMALLSIDLIDGLGLDMANDVARLHGGEVVDHA